MTAWTEENFRQYSSGALGAHWTSTTGWMVVWNTAQVDDGAAHRIALWDTPMRDHHYQIEGYQRSIFGDSSQYQPPDIFGSGGIVFGASDDLTEYYLLLTYVGNVPEEGYYPDETETWLIRQQGGEQTILWTSPIYVGPGAGGREIKQQYWVRRRGQNRIEILQRPNYPDHPVAVITDNNPLLGKRIGMYCSAGYNHTYGSEWDGQWRPIGGAFFTWRFREFAVHKPVFLVVNKSSGESFPCVNLLPGAGETFEETDGILKFPDNPTSNLGDDALLVGV